METPLLAHGMREREREREREKGLRICDSISFHSGKGEVGVIRDSCHIYVKRISVYRFSMCPYYLLLGERKAKASLSSAHTVGCSPL